MSFSINRLFSPASAVPQLTVNGDGHPGSYCKIRNYSFPIMFVQRFTCMTILHVLKHKYSMHVKILKFVNNLTPPEANRTSGRPSVGLLLICLLKFFSILLHSCIMQSRMSSLLVSLLKYPLHVKIFNLKKTCDKSHSF